MNFCGSNLIILKNEHNREYRGNTTLFHGCIWLIVSNIKVLFNTSPNEIDDVDFFINERLKLIFLISNNC